MSEVTSKPDLLEQGTRYDHYVELREVFATGLEVINGLEIKNLATDGDRVLRKKLEGAVEVINKRLEFLSDYGANMRYGADLPNEIRAIHLRATIERERNDAEKRRAQVDQAEKDFNQVRPEENSGESTGVS